MLREYAMPLAQDAFKTLSARYGFTPTGPILVEIFPQARRLRGAQPRAARHDRRARRLLRARRDAWTRRRRGRPGTFSWQATLWHELTHVVTLQMSKQRIPRWLTEGISVYEEGRKRAEWGRDMEITFARAMDQGKVLKLKDLNAGFTKPDTISLAYYEASLLVEHIVDDVRPAGAATRWCGPTPTASTPTRR